MSSRKNPIRLLCIFILFTVVVQLCHTLANQAVYIIENIGSKQCLSAGGVIRNGSDPNITLFKHGRAISKPCSDISLLNTTDFSQQWILKIHKESPWNFTYEIQLAMLNTLYSDVNLKVEIRGEFIAYFPDEIRLKGHHLVDEKTQSQEFIISDPTTEKCLSDGEDGTKIQFVKCDGTTPMQKWNFTLVNEVLLMQKLLSMTPTMMPPH